MARWKTGPAIQLDDAVEGGVAKEAAASIGMRETMMLSETIWPTTIEEITLACGRGEPRADISEQEWFAEQINEG